MNAPAAAAEAGAVGTAGETAQVTLCQRVCEVVTIRKSTDDCAAGRRQGSVGDRLKARRDCRNVVTKGT